MKILFVSPPTISAIKAVIGTTGPPLGLAYLASVGREKGHEVKIIDSLAQNLDFDGVKQIVKSYSPDLVGITSTTSMIPDAYRIAELVKLESNDIKVLIGGPHVTFVPEETLRESPYIDYVIRGEGEASFSLLLDHLTDSVDIRDVRGLSYRNGSGIINNPPQPLIKEVDGIPKPALDLLPMNEYKVDEKEFATIMTSRGCPYNCIFCSSSLQFGKVWRGHSVDRVMEELKDLVYVYGKKEIEFLDDTFTLNLKRASALTDSIKKEGLDISWTASARVNLFNKGIAYSLKQAGAHTIYFGVESGVQRTLDFIGKGITPEMAKQAIDNAKEADLRSLGSFIIGFPDDTVEDVKTTLSFSRKLNLSFAQFTVATPYPGTRLWDYVVSKDLLLTKNWRKFTTLSPVIKLQNFTSEQILKWLQGAYLRFYARPSFLLKDLFLNKGFIFKRIIPYSRAFSKFKPIFDGIEDTTYSKSATNPAE